MGKIINFPKQSDKVKVVKINFSPAFYKNGALLGLGVIFLFALVLNFSLQDQNTQNRELANYQGANDEATLDDYILKSLNSSDSDTEIVFSKKPDQEDKLIFDTLLGSYNVIKVNNKIAQIHLKPGYTPLKLLKLPIVLSQYRKATQMENLEFQLQTNSDQMAKDNYVYDLISKGQIIGSLIVTVDQDRQILSLNTNYK